MLGPANQPNKKNSGIEKFSEATRKKILIGSISLITLILLTVWLKTFSASVSSVLNKKPSSEFSEAFEKTKTGLGQISEEVNKIKEASKLLETIATTTPATTTTTPEAELDEESFNKLKKIILELEASSTATTTGETKEQP